MLTECSVCTCNYLLFCASFLPVILIFRTLVVIAQVPTQCLHLSLCVRTSTILVPTRSDTNQHVQSQMMDRGWKFWIKKVEELYNLCSENKGAD